jgi:hypothetical protein
MDGTFDYAGALELCQLQDESPDEVRGEALVSPTPPDCDRGHDEDEV